MILFSRAYKKLLLPVLVLISIVSLLLFSFRNKDSLNILNLSSDDSTENINKLDSNFDYSAADHQYRPVYQNIESSISLNALKTKTFDERCKIYFEELFNKVDADWKIQNREDDDVSFTDLKMNEDLVHSNVYSACFMDSSNSKLFADLSSQFNIDNRFYPYLHKKFPIFQKWNGQLFYGPMKKSLKNKNFSNNLKNLDKSVFKYNIKSFDFNQLNAGLPLKPYWKQYKDSLRGEGIVVSLADSFMNYGVSLIGNLREIGTELPIEIVHRGDLSDANKLKIVDLARKNYKNLKKLDVWFVDVSQVLSNEYEDAFGGYFNKLLAYTLNSFQTTILLDSDVVLFHNPEKFFQTTEFLESQTLFFKDRNLNPKSDSEFVKFLRYNSPKKIDTLFNVNNLDSGNKVFDLSFFKDEDYHFMEAGVVVIDRFKYWNAVINTLLLTFYRPIYGSSWGDKELFWFSMILSGYDDFQFNKYWSGSIGDIFSEESGYYKKVCSTHPAHIFNEHELSWINSGIINCKKATDELIEDNFSYINDIEGYYFESSKELKTFYASAISFGGIIVPPTSAFTLEDGETAEHEKGTGWEKLSICDGYIWCAYNKVGSGELEGQHGTVVEFDEEQIKKYEAIAQSYINFV